MSRRTSVKVKVLEIRGGGKCPFDLKVGDEFVFEHLPPKNFCHWAFHSMLPFMTALRFGGNIPWEEEKGVCRACCPDPDNTVVFEIKRVTD